jgi:hypothetical protein
VETLLKNVHILLPFNSTSVFFPKFLVILQNTVSNGPGGSGSNSNGRQKPRPNSSRDTRPKLLLTLKYNRSTSVLSVVIHKAVNLQVGGQFHQVPTYSQKQQLKGTQE